MSAILKPVLADAEPSIDALLERARAMIPWLREQADAVEQARQVPRATIDAFVDAGFFKILQPRRWGGWEMHPEVFWRVLMELGRGCSSSAWNMMILGVHQWEFGHLDPRAGDDVWGNDNKVIIASSYPPVGAVKRVEGGFVLDGRWPTSSGTDHGDWAFVGGFLRNEQGVPVDRYSFLVPRDDYEVIDDWFTFGLCGTGSKSLRIREAFVPDHRCHSMVEYSHSDRGTMYYWPFSQIFYGSVSAVICGYGQAAIDMYTEQMRVRQATGTGAAVNLSPYVRDRLANAVVKVSSARARLLQMMADSTPLVQARQLIPIADRVRHLTEIAHVGRDVEQAVLLLYKATGARGVYRSNPIQRVLRDTLAAANHITQNGDDTAGWLGSQMLGGELPPLVFTRPGDDIQAA
ncbi:acyl-CoA dehydrogenase family protein [Cupriavidus sp. CP313]